MPTERQPSSIPYIEEVLEPASGFYIVVVRLDARTALKWPDKPWGLSIEDIGLPPADTEKYAGYVLVRAAKAYREASDALNWFFQKLDGPVWTTRTIGQENVIPAKYRRFVTQTRTKQEVVPATLPNTPQGDLILSHVEQVENSGLAVIQEILETLNADADALTGEQAYVEREVGLVSEELVEEGTPADQHLMVVQSEVEALGNGKAVKRTVVADNWHQLVASFWDDEFQTQIKRYEQYVAPPVDFSEHNVSHQIVNRDRSLKVTDEAPDDAIRAIHHQFPTEDSVRIPDTLKSAGVLVTRNLANGNSLTAGHSFAVMNTSSVAMQADMVYELEEGFEGSVPATVHIFYLKIGEISVDTIRAMVGAEPWPFYRPRATRVAVSGCPRDQSITFQSGEGGQSISEKSSCGAFVNTVVFPASLHGILPITVTYSNHEAPTGLTDAIVDEMTNIAQKRLEIMRKALEDGEKMFGLDTTDTDNHDLVEQYLDMLADQITITKDLDLDDFTVTVEPAALPATSPDAVTTGTFIKNTSVRIHKYGWVQVNVLTVTIPEA